MSSSGDKESKVEKLSQKYLGKVAFEHGRGWLKFGGDDEERELQTVHTDGCVLQHLQHPCSILGGRRCPGDGGYALACVKDRRREAAWRAATTLV